MNLWRRKSIQALAWARRQRETARRTPSSGSSSGTPGPELGHCARSPGPRRNGCGLPLLSFQISRYTPRPNPRSAHSSAGGSASCQKLFSISSSSSSTRSILAAEIANCRRVKSGEPGGNGGGEKERESTRRRAHAPTSRGPKRHAQAAPPAPGE